MGLPVGRASVRLEGQVWGLGVAVMVIYVSLGQLAMRQVVLEERLGEKTRSGPQEAGDSRRLGRGMGAVRV